MSLRLACSLGRLVQRPSAGLASSSLRRSFAAVPPTPTPELPAADQKVNALNPTQTAASHPPSSTPAGTPIPEVVIYTNQKTPIAMEDHEYPDWLWNLIGEGRAVSKKDLGEGDASRGRNWVENVGKRVVRQTNRGAIKTANLLKSS